MHDNHVSLKNGFGLVAGALAEAWSHFLDGLVVESSLLLILANLSFCLQLVLAEDESVH